MSFCKFTNIEMSNELRKSIEEIGYETATSIQSQAIPIIRSGEDVIGLSQTGSGKTAAFGLPAIDIIESDIDPKSVQVLIVCPTRELALQSSEQLRKFAKYKRNINIVTIYGGDSINRQINAMRSGCQIVVGTPGRIMDHMRRRTIRLEKVKMVVLDEADEMLNMGFVEDIENILSSTPEERQTLLFSATMSESIMKITNKFLKLPKVIKVENSQKTVSTIEQYFTISPSDKKTEVLISFLEYYKPKVAIIFCNTKKMVSDLVDKLIASNYAARGLHGDMRQTERTRVINEIKNHKFKILVATDVVARGIDIDDVEIVFNYDIPKEDEYFIHRTGRTGRAGKSGKAISIVHNANDLRAIKYLAKYANCSINELPIPSVSQIKENSENELINEVKSVIDSQKEYNYTSALKSLNDSGYDTERVALAMLEMLMKQRASSANFFEEVTFAKDSNDLYTKQKSKKIRTAFNSLDYDSSDMETIRISIGKKDKVSVNHILGAAAGETGLPGSVFGAIKIENKYTDLDVPKEYKKFIVDKLNKARIKGLKVKVY